MLLLLQAHVLAEATIDDNLTIRRVFSRGLELVLGFNFGLLAVLEVL